MSKTGGRQRKDRTVTTPTIAQPLTPDRNHDTGTQTRYAAVVTLEFDALPPRVVRTEILAGNPYMGVSRACKAAFKRHPRSHWRSLVVVLERPGDQSDV